MINFTRDLTNSKALWLDLSTLIKVSWGRAHLQTCHINSGERICQLAMIPGNEGQKESQVLVTSKEGALLQC